MQTGFNMVDILCKYIRYALNEKPFNPQMVAALIHLRKITMLDDSQVAEILNEISKLIKASIFVFSASVSTNISSLKSQIKEFGERLESANAKARSYEREAEILKQEKFVWSRDIYQSLTGLRMYMKDVESLKRKLNEQLSLT
ncbi:hypothetical protein CTI12_AA109280 [Artemisia annua]|uniref:Armadillo-like repeats domain-containing protein n=1 Tax=Artemisia annua TaxID=35608 RepID=A0A2U1PUD7_ARTAN|nr:hypothetical protein CTI12_AA109280 [Artemisia annua]